MKLQGFRGRSRNFSSPSMESELQYVNHREQLTTFKQENHMVCLAFLMDHCGRCVDRLIGFQDRWLETTFQQRDDKPIPIAVVMDRGGRSICQASVVSQVLGWMLSFMSPRICVQKRAHNCIAHHTKTEHTMVDCKIIRMTAPLHQNATDGIEIACLGVYIDDVIAFCSRRANMAFSIHRSQE